MTPKVSYSKTTILMLNIQRNLFNNLDLGIKRSIQQDNIRNATRSSGVNVGKEAFHWTQQKLAWPAKSPHSNPNILFA